MAAGTGKTSDFVDLFSDLEKKCGYYDFFQTLRYIECKDKKSPRIGYSSRPSNEAVRFSQNPSMAFAPTALSGFKQGENGSAHRLSLFFFGLFGPNGPMPLHLSDFIQERKRKGDYSFIRFTDIFHHRFLSLFYRVFADTQPVFSFDRPEEDKFIFYVNSLIGIGEKSQQNRSVVPDEVRRFFAGIFSCQTRHSEGLKAILESYFLVPVAIEEFIGHWLEIPEECGWKLGKSWESGILGKTVLLGAQVWDFQNKFRVVIGPVDIRNFDRFLPGKTTLKKLISIVREYISDQLVWDIKLKLKKEDIPSTRLGVAGTLGWTTWIGKKSDAISVDMIFDPLKNGNVN